MDITGITEEFVQRNAVNSSAFDNARKISTKNEFIGRNITADKSLLFGDCRGSGKEPYHTSVDLSGEAPVFRCSCPSRQIPCKHVLALMLDYVAGKNFAEGEVPEDVVVKREKLAKRAMKAAADADKESDEASGVDGKKKTASVTAARKKVQKQLEGLALVSDFVQEILQAGIGTINSSTIARYKDLTKQLGDYYLNGPQRLMQGIILEAEADREGKEASLVKQLVRLDQTARRGKAYLEKQLETGQFGPQDDILYEEMGGIWKLDQLDTLGLYKEDARLCQLSFHVLWDPAQRAEIDTGYWIDLESGDISKTENIRPVKAKKYIHADDSAFEVYTVKKLYQYPGGINKRIRWDDAGSEERGADIPSKILNLARQDLAATIKEVKNELKNTLSDNGIAVLVSFDRIEFADGHCVLKKGEEQISVKENTDYTGTISVLRLLRTEQLQNGSMLGEFFYEANEAMIYFAPITVVTPNEILRLL